MGLLGCKLFCYRPTTEEGSLRCPVCILFSRPLKNLPYFSPFAEALFLRIESQYDIHFELQRPTPIVSMLKLHTSLIPSVVGTELYTVATGDGSPIEVADYTDAFDNRCSRFVAPAGLLMLRGTSLIEAPDSRDVQGYGLPTTPVEELPAEVLQFLVPSRYCEVDRFGAIAQDTFGHLGSGWALAASIRDWVHQKVAFNYRMARATKTAMDVYTERVGVCRDFQHLAVTLSRCMNLPARYVTGYLGDIRIPFSGVGDFSAWYQVWLGGKWWDMDARHNEPRFGRTLMAVGRDAADVAITTSFGNADLRKFCGEWCGNNGIACLSYRWLRSRTLSGIG
jgi:transglutaminase-like putative cysteine protease